MIAIGLNTYGSDVHYWYPLYMGDGKKGGADNLGYGV